MGTESVCLLFTVDHFRSNGRIAVNELSDHLTNAALRIHLMELSFSLYEGLGDFLAEMVRVDAGDIPADELPDVLKRMSIASMDCLADIELIAPILRSIRQSLAGG